MSATATRDPALTPELVAKYRELYLGDPVRRIETCNGFKPWSKQQEIIQALYRDRRVAVQSCHGVGKTAVAAAIVEDFMRLGPCRIVTTAPTNHQVETLLWGEIRKRARMARVQWQKKPSMKRWTIREDWAAFGFSTNEPERFSGHHGARLLFVVDEASGVDEQIFNAARGFLTGANSYVLMIGNPTQMVGTFYDNCQATATRWTRIKMGAKDTPVYTGEKVDAELLEQLPQRDWVEEMKDDWGEDSSEYRVRVLGEFAPVVGRLYYPSKHVQRIQPVPPRREGFLSGDVAPRPDGSPGRVSFTEEKGGPLRIWTIPDVTRRYAIFADVAGQVREESYEMRERARRGSGDDYCAAVVVDLETGVQVAEYRSHDDPDQYGEMLARLGYVYRGADGRKGALLGVESNNMGQAALATLKKAKYRNVFRRQRRENARPTRAPALGLVTTRDSKERILTYLGATLRERPDRIKSEVAKFELERFVKNELGYGEAAVGFHDDTVIAWGGVLEMRDQVLRRPGSDEVAA